MRMNDERLTPAELAALVDADKMLAPRMAPEVRDSLIRKGLVEQKLGGIGRTRQGDLYILKHRRR